MNRDKVPCFIASVVFFILVIIALAIGPMLKTMVLKTVNVTLNANYVDNFGGSGSCTTPATNEMDCIAAYCIWSYSAGSSISTGTCAEPKDKKVYTNWLSGSLDPKQQTKAGLTTSPHLAVFNYYLYSVTNPKDILTGTVPNVKAVGPFPFYSYSQVVHANWDFIAGTVEVTSNSWYEYAGGDNAVDLSTPITMVNLGFLGGQWYGYQKALNTATGGNKNLNPYVEPSLIPLADQFLVGQLAAGVIGQTITKLDNNTVIGLALNQGNAILKALTDAVQTSGGTLGDAANGGHGDAAATAVLLGAASSVLGGFVQKINGLIGTSGYVGDGGAGDLTVIGFIEQMASSVITQSVADIELFIGTYGGTLGNVNSYSLAKTAILNSPMVAPGINDNVNKIKAGVTAQSPGSVVGDAGTGDVLATYVLFSKAGPLAATAYSNLQGAITLNLGKVSNCGSDPVLHASFRCVSDSATNGTATAYKNDNVLAESYGDTVIFDTLVGAAFGTPIPQNIFNIINAQVQNAGALGDSTIDNTGSSALGPGDVAALSILDSLFSSQVKVCYKAAGGGSGADFTDAAKYGYAAGVLSYWMAPMNSITSQSFGVTSKPILSGSGASLAINSATYKTSAKDLPLWNSAVINGIHATAVDATSTMAAAVAIEQYLQNACLRAVEYNNGVPVFDGTSLGLPTAASINLFATTTDPTKATLLFRSAIAGYLGVIVGLPDNTFTDAQAVGCKATPPTGLTAGDCLRPVAYYPQLPIDNIQLVAASMVASKLGFVLHNAASLTTAVQNLFLGAIQFPSSPQAFAHSDLINLVGNLVVYGSGFTVGNNATLVPALNSLFLGGIGFTGTLSLTKAQTAIGNLILGSFNLPTVGSGTIISASIATCNALGVCNVDGSYNAVGAQAFLGQMMLNGGDGFKLDLCMSGAAPTMGRGACLDAIDFAPYAYYGQYKYGLSPAGAPKPSNLLGAGAKASFNPVTSTTSAGGTYVPFSNNIVKALWEQMSSPTTGLLFFTALAGGASADPKAVPGMSNPASSSYYEVYNPTTKSFTSTSNGCAAVLVATFGGLMNINSTNSIAAAAANQLGPNSQYLLQLNCRQIADLQHYAQYLAYNIAFTAFGASATSIGYTNGNKVANAFDAGGLFVTLPAGSFLANGYTDVLATGYQNTWIPPIFASYGSDDTTNVQVNYDKRTFICDVGGVECMTGTCSSKCATSQAFWMSCFNMNDPNWNTNQGVLTPAQKAAQCPSGVVGTKTTVTGTLDTVNHVQVLPKLGQIVAINGMNTVNYFGLNTPVYGFTGTATFPPNGNGVIYIPGIHGPDANRPKWNSTIDLWNPGFSRVMHLVNSGGETQTSWNGFSLPILNFTLITGKGMMDRFQTNTNYNAGLDDDEWVPQSCMVNLAPSLGQPIVGGYAYFYGCDLANDPVFKNIAISTFTDSTNGAAPAVIPSTNAADGATLVLQPYLGAPVLVILAPTPYEMIRFGRSSSITPSFIPYYTAQVVGGMNDAMKSDFGLLLSTVVKLVSMIGFINYVIALVIFVLFVLPCCFCAFRKPVNVSQPNKNIAMTEVSKSPSNSI